MLQVIDTAQYAGAAALLTRGNQALAAVALRLFDALGDAALSAGRGSGARQWCDAYERSAAAAAGMLSQLVDALGACARLIDASGHNHARAEAAAAPYGLPSYALPQRDLASVGLTGIPTMYGGSVDEPWGWGLIASHLAGLGWPGADLGQVRAVAHAWHRAAGRVRDLGYLPGQAAAELELMSAAELPDAIAVCQRLGKAALTLADDCDALGAACTRYADHVLEQRTRVEHEVEEFFAAAGITELVGCGLSVITAGISALVARAADAGILATYVARIARLLDALDRSLAGYAPALAGAGVGAGVGADAAWLGMVAESEPVFAEVEAANALLASEVDAAGGGMGSGLAGTALDAEAVLSDDAVIESGWADRRTLARHLRDHADDVGATTEAEYVRSARELLKRARAEGLPMKVAPDGTIRVFDPVSELFGSYRSDGLARTIFRPDPPATDYWAKQPGVLQ